MILPHHIFFVFLFVFLKFFLKITENLPIYRVPIVSRRMTLFRASLDQLLDGLLDQDWYQVTVLASLSPSLFYRHNSGTLPIQHASTE